MLPRLPVQRGRPHNGSQLITLPPAGQMEWPILTSEVEVTGSRRARARALHQCLEKSELFCRAGSVQSSASARPPT